MGGEESATTQTPSNMGGNAQTNVNCEVTYLPDCKCESTSPECSVDMDLSDNSNGPEQNM